ncbi:MAG TPA: ABC transporter, partial [Opitutae bacterium]|nr:ABC transporter [Opitutae bacterium]
LLAGVICQDRGELYVKKGLHGQLLSLGVGLEGHLSGRENAVLNGMLLGKTRKYMLNCVEKIKEFSELGDFFDCPVNTYSSGMVARLGFSVAMEVEPDVLMLDELLGVGDVGFAEKSNKAMEEKFSSEKTVILISHNPNTIHRLCDRAVWIDNGRTVMEGSTDVVSEKYTKAMKA